MVTFLEQGAPISYILLVFFVYIIASLLYQILWFRNQKKLIREEIFNSLNEMISQPKYSVLVKDILDGDLSYYRSCRSMIRQLYWTKLVINLSPLLGLLGTVLGIMESTTGILTQDNSYLLGGVAESLMTTAMGIIVSIPGMFSYYFGRSLLNSNITDIKTRLVK